MVNIIQKRGTSFVTVTDQFCGAGGSSQGARRKTRAKEHGK